MSDCGGFYDLVPDARKVSVPAAPEAPKAVPVQPAPSKPAGNGLGGWIRLVVIALVVTVLAVGQFLLMARVSELEASVQQLNADVKELEDLVENGLPEVEDTEPSDPVPSDPVPSDPASSDPSGEMPKPTEPPVEDNKSWWSDHLLFGDDLHEYEDESVEILLGSEHVAAERTCKVKGDEAKLTYDFQDSEDEIVVKVERVSRRCYTVSVDPSGGRFGSNLKEAKLIVVCADGYFEIEMERDDQALSFEYALTDGDFEDQEDVLQSLVVYWSCADAPQSQMAIELTALDRLAE